MSYFDVLDTAATGLSAQRIRMSVLSSNMANANTTRTEDGGPNRKKNVIFKQVLTGELKGGVQVDKIYEDTKPPRLQYNLLEAARAYESNLTILQSAKQLSNAALEIGRQ